MKEITHQEFLDAIRIVKQYKKLIDDRVSSIMTEINNESILDITKDTNLFESNLSVRLINQICSYYNHKEAVINQSSTIGDIDGISIHEFLKLRGVGSKSIQELQNVALYTGINLT